jgi:antitoxin component HigA of HigAB toxin-antitoxin module
MDDVVKVPLGQITSERDYERRVRVMDELLDRIGANESHRLMPLLDLITKEVESYENKNHTLPYAAPAAVLAYLMEEPQANRSC